MAKTTLTPSEVANQAGRESLVEADGFQATAATGTPVSLIASRKLQLKALTMKALTAGTAGATTAKVQKNGVDVAGAQASIDNAEADGTTKSAGPVAETILNAGDMATVVVTAAATGGANVGFKLVCAEVYD